MPTFAPQQPDYRAMIVEALGHVRNFRHHSDCRCGNHRYEGAPYCTPQHALWSEAVDRLIEHITERRA